MSDIDCDTYLGHFDAGTLYQMKSPRNYLEEASAILENRTIMMPQREHLEALCARIKELEERQ